MDETMMLIDRAHQGDKEARDQLVLDNMGLIWSIVRRFQGRGSEMEDLFQIGSIGLLKAIDKFDLSYEVRFSTYAVPMITSKEEVAASMEAGAEVESLYKSVQKQDESGLCLMDKIEDQNQDHEKLLNHMVLEELIEQLGDKEKEIILRRYYENQTQTEIAKALNISQVQVSRLEKRILRQMREKL